MKKTKKHIWLAIIAIIIAALAFGYAYLTTTLSINGITDIDRNSWDVYFDNVQVTEGSVTGEQEIEAPTITSDTEVEFHVNLKKPGDFYEFTIEARNDGTIDAMINSVSKKLNNVEITTLPSYLNYTVTYEDDIEIQDNHLLAAESLETYKVRIEYKSNISASDLPSTAQSLTLSFGVEYVQADDNASNVRTLLYAYDFGNGNYISKGESIPQNITMLNDYQNIINNHSLVFLKVTTVNNVVIDGYLGVSYNNNVIYIRSGGASYNSTTNSYNTDSIYYDSNKALMKDFFGEDNCIEDINDDDITLYTCQADGYAIATAKNNGEIEASSAYNCIIYDDGDIYCAHNS